MGGCGGNTEVLLLLLGSMTMGASRRPDFVAFKMKYLPLKAVAAPGVGWSGGQGAVHVRYRWIVSCPGGQAQGACPYHGRDVRSRVPTRSGDDEIVMTCRG